MNLNKVIARMLREQADKISKAYENPPWTLHHIDEVILMDEPVEHNYDHIVQKLLTMADELENKVPTKWYNCARCDAGYDSGLLEQKCICEEGEECPKGTHESLDEALGCWKCQNASLRAWRAKNESR